MSTMARCWRMTAEAGRIVLRRRQEPVAEFVARIRAEAGLPPKCGDPAILGRVARELVERRQISG